MTIPIGPIKPLIASYREPWRESGHPGDGEVMIAFHMFCYPDARRAREIARAPLEKYFQLISDSTREWIDRTTISKDYRDYDKSMVKMKSSTLERQIETGSAWIGTPDEVRSIIAGYRQFRPV